MLRTLDGRMVVRRYQEYWLWSKPLGLGFLEDQSPESQPSFDNHLCHLTLFLHEARCVLPCITWTRIFPLLNLFCPSPVSVSPGCHSNGHFRNDDGRQQEFLRLLHFCLLRTSNTDKSTHFGGVGCNGANWVSVQTQTETLIPSNYDFVCVKRIFEPNDAFRDCSLRSKSFSCKSQH